MKYLRKFETEADVMMMVQPNVVLVGDEARILYNVEPLKGAFIQHIDGKLYTTDQWTAGGFTNDEANGVAVIADEAKFVIAKSYSTKIAWSANTVAVEGVMQATGAYQAKNDLDGKNNTELIAASTTSGAAYMCSNFTFPNGAKGYFPAYGELFIAFGYKTEISTAMELIGGSIPVSIWSSTQYNESNAWYIKWSSGDGYTASKMASMYYAWPFTSLTL